MKNKILLSLVLGALTAFSATVTLTESVAVRLDVPAPKLTVFVSYPGKIGNQCGVKLLHTDQLGGEIAESVADNLVLRLNEIELPLNPPVIKGKYSFPEKIKDQGLFGAFLTIETRDGRNLSEVNSEGESELILVSTPCKL